MSIAFQLDVPALERLLGGDTEVEVKLRQGVVEEFAKRHLVKVLKDESFAKFLAAEKKVIEARLEAALHEHIGQIKTEPGGFLGRDKITVYLQREMKDAIEIEAEKRVAEVVKKTVDEIWARREPQITREVYRLLSEKTDRLTEALVKDLVQQRLDKIMASLKA